MDQGRGLKGGGQGQEGGILSGYVPSSRSHHEPSPLTTPCLSRWRLQAARCRVQGADRRCSVLRPRGSPAALISISDAPHGSDSHE